MTDLELMELLEAEGYEPDIENLMILKEGLETGKYEIINEGIMDLIDGKREDWHSARATKFRGKASQTSDPVKAARYNSVANRNQSAADSLRSKRIATQASNQQIHSNKLAGKVARKNINNLKAQVTAEKLKAKTRKYQNMNNPVNKLKDLDGLII